MILYRFMSREELRRLQAGQTVINESKHEGNRTTSRGFCFTEDDPQEAIRYLKGIVDTDVCVKFKVPDGCFRRTKGIYRDPDNDHSTMLPMSFNNVAHIERTEYCTTRYSLKQVEIVNVTTAYANLPGIKATQALLKALGYKLNIKSTYKL